jgi:hypothetical protein
MGQQGPRQWSATVGRHPAAPPGCPAARDYLVLSGTKEALAALEGLQGTARAAAAASGVIAERLNLTTAERVHVSMARPMGKPPADPTRRRFYLIQVERRELDTIVHNRHRLKGAPLAIFDYMTPEEQAARKQLWSTFIEARTRGLRAQFHRAKLVVTKCMGNGTTRKYTIWPASM